MLSNYPHLDEALKKLSVHQLTISQASEYYDLPKRVIYKALRQQQAKIAQQKSYLLAAQKRLQQNLQSVELELANFN
ncbi:helix-turn-helix domain-containing protein [Pseudoalteromonas rhizosphaerae]|uniref:Helix-turn-helix domain-containing protein n=1 Tax=Pseudoalteromonas rhizosphaerae TaxID=2518973 RepID=A0ABW8KZF1_9GAMM